MTRLQRDLQARKDRVAALLANARLKIERGKRLIMWSRVLTRCRGKQISGGTDDVSAVLARLRVLIENGTLPRKPPAKAFVGPTNDGHACIGCGGKLEQGEIEYELDMDSHVLYLHRRCFELWREVDGQSA